MMKITVDGKQIELSIKKSMLLSIFMDVLIKNHEQRRLASQSVISEDGKLDINLQFPIIGEVTVGTFKTKEDLELFAFGLRHAIDVSKTVTEFGDVVEIVTGLKKTE